MAGTFGGGGAGHRLPQDPRSAGQPRRQWLGQENGLQVFSAPGLGGLRNESGVFPKTSGFTQLEQKL